MSATHDPTPAAGGHDLSVGVLVCTHDAVRLPMVAACIASLGEQSRRVDEMLVMVDGDEALAQQVRRALPDGVRVECMGTNQGVSRARNEGARLMSSQWIVFLDDDAEAETAWLEALVAPLGEPGVLGVSGTSLPIFDVPRPAWLPGEYLWAFGCSYDGMPTTTAKVRNFFGGAAVVGRELFLELGGFSADVGHHGDRVGGGEEATYCLEAARATGGWFVFEPTAVAHHHLPASRLTWRYLIRRCYGEGIMKSRLAAAHGGASLADERGFALQLPAAVLRAARRPGTLPRVAGLVVASLAVIAGLLVGRVQTALPGRPGRPGRPHRPGQPGQRGRR